MRSLNRLRPLFRISDSPAAPWVAVGLGLPLCCLLILFSLCTLIPAAQKAWLAPASLPVSGSTGQLLSLPKATFAHACSRDGAHCLEDVVLIYGKLDSGTWDAFQKLVGASAQKPKTLCFHSPGGSVATATQLAGWIIANNADTCLAERYFIKGQGTLQNTICHSACPLVLLTGAERTLLGNELKMLVHRPGIRLNFCFACWKTSLSDFFAYYLWHDMLTQRNRPEDRAHLKFLERALKTDFSQTEALPPDEWPNFSVFTNTQSI